jgi:galactoside O-acetyltransferase
MSEEIYYSRAELEAMQFKSLGKHVLVSRVARLYSPPSIALGDHCIVDDFCILLGNVELGRNVHIAHGCRVLAGRDGIRMQDFSGLAFGVTVFAQSDDYGGTSLTNPTVPRQYRKITRAPVDIGRHVIVGTHSVVLPGVVMGEGSSIGACSLVTRSTEPWTIYLGTPAKAVRARSRDMLLMEAQYLQDDRGA